MATQTQEIISTFKQRAEHLKERGKGLFKNNNLVEAIQAYQQGFMLCNKYFEAVDRDLPVKCDFAGAEESQATEEKMWLHEFELLKGIFCNNMAMCYQKMGDLKSADIYNNWALKECPDYAKALHRKCLILEA